METEKKKKIIIAIILIIVITAGGFLFFKNKDKQVKKQIDLGPKEARYTGPANAENVSPISGMACDNWNKRPIAVMQPADILARPAAGFSEADMVIEMPAYTSSVTRLMGVYVCDIPKAIGAIRSSRHDYIALASGLDAIFVHWGGSHFALDLLKGKIIDNIECLVYDGKYCFRWTDTKRIEDSGHVTKEGVLAAIKDLGYRDENKFAGYPHKEEASMEDRPNGGHLRVAFAKPYDVEYDYDKETNSWLRVWAEVADTDRNNGKRLAPKNIAVLMARSNQISINEDYTGKGLQDPWKNVEEIKKTGTESISDRYNNVQIGDPWYDESDSGEAFYYMNGKETRGSWKKDKSKLDSKLYFYDESGQEARFVPGQIWVEILEPGQALKWVPAS
ncbi:MAG TPA: hypothetical protein DCS28_00290 [Candidatus Moranbacteria bacterium]|nr:hypothetical protein [Candidatus Moranbacteria bacterium]HAT74472.1 hypothetical protein [Candidatus Moranbacteria bacterium]